MKSKTANFKNNDSDEADQRSSNIDAVLALTLDDDFDQLDLTGKKKNPLDMDSSELVNYCKLASSNFQCGSATQATHFFNRLVFSY